MDRAFDRHDTEFFFYSEYIFIYSERKLDYRTGVGLNSPPYPVRVVQHNRNRQEQDR